MTATNLCSGLTHLVPPDWADTLPMQLWRARCGWGFSSRAARLGRGEPAHPVCRKCLATRARCGVPGVGVHAPDGSGSDSG